MNQLILSLIFCFTLFSAVYSQYEPCYTDHLVNKRMQTDAQYAREINELLNNPPVANSLQTRAVRTISVVVHVLYNTAAKNVSQNIIDNMITVLNEDYRAQNADLANVRAQFTSSIADAEMEFCLDRVLRVQTSQSCYDPNTQSDNMKTESPAVNPSHYLNIWIVDICGNQFGGVAGYAYLPTFGMHGSSVDGLVIDYDIGLGTRTVTHEIGHYFGLAHTFAGCNNRANNCTDIPYSNTANTLCNPSATSCNSLDQWENHMDYTFCRYMFTTCQANVMNSVLTNIRSSLLSSPGCSSGSSAPTANFTSDETSGCPGLQVTYTDQSTGNPTSWSWSFQGGSPASSTSPNPTVTYNAPGSFNVTLTVTNATGSDSETKTGYITILGAGTLPLSEGFQNTAFPPAGWSLINPNNNGEWIRTPSAGGYGQSSASAAFDNYNDDERGDFDFLVTPIYNFNGVSNPRLKFDYAYAQYNATFADSLIVAYSINCGENFIFLWGKGGSNLATAPNHTVDFVPTSGEWATDSIDLSNLAGQATVQLAFVNVSGYSNWLYIDNVNLYNASANPPPVADFTGSPLTIPVGGTVDFTDLSLNNPTGWNWSFPGAVQTGSLQQNPSGIQYINAGTFDVTLSVTGPGGFDSKTETGYVTVIDTGTSIGSCDTISNVQPNDSLITYTVGGANGWGFVAGHNNYGDIAKADKYTGVASGSQVTGAYFYFTKAAFANVNSFISVKVWDADGLDAGGNAGAPGTELTFDNILISSLASNSMYTYVNFSNPATVNGDFYLGIEFAYNPGDTVALRTTVDGFTSPATAWEKWGNGNWYHYETSWPLSVAHDIYPVVCEGTTGTAPAAAFVANASTVCQGQAVTFTDQSTGGPTGWLWSFPGGSPSSSNQQNPVVTYNSVGTYHVELQVSNTNGINTIMANNLITVSSAPAGNITVTSITCHGINDGAMSLAVAGGTPPYNYAWSNGAVSQNISNLQPGTYTVTITDAIGCSSSGSRTVNEPAPLNIQVFSTTADCGVANGTASVSVTGGTNPYNYGWSNGEASQAISGLTSGIYSVTVTDNNGCEQIEQVTIENVGVEQDISLSMGWNMISSYIIPVDPDMMAVISDIQSDILLVKDYLGQTAIPILSLNSIGNWNVTHGYKVKASAPVTLTIGCQQANPLTTPIPVSTGWSIISYLRNTSMDIATALGSINAELLISKDAEGNVYLPSIGINTIGNMIPGQGYKVKVTNSTVLTYPANAKSSGLSFYQKPSIPEHFQISQNTGFNATVVLPDKCIDGTLSAGDEIGIYSEDGRLAGAAVYQGTSMAIAVWGDDLTTGDQVEGMLEGQEFIYKVWRKDRNKEFGMKVEYAGGDIVYLNDGLSFLKKIEIADKQYDREVSFECYPNPNEGEFEIRLHQEEYEPFVVEVLNMVGQVV